MLKNFQRRLATDSFHHTYQPTDPDFENNRELGLFERFNESDVCSSDISEEFLRLRVKQ